MKRELSTSKNTKNIYINLRNRMNPHQLIGLTGPTNNFAMGGIPMHLANFLIVDGKPVPHVLFLDIMVEKMKILVEHVNNHHLGLSDS